MNPKTHEVQLSWPQQSPVDLTGALYSPDLPTLRIKYPKNLHGEFQDDHNLKILNPGAAIIEYDGMQCPLVKLHFHAPSEHTLDRAIAHLEVHLIHKVPGFPESAASAFIVIGVFYDVEYKGKYRPKSKSRHAKLSEALIPVFFERDKQGQSLSFDPNEFLPTDRKKFFRYEGSLTTAPFSEFVSWIVMHEHAKLDTPIEYEVHEKTTESAREIQPLNRRFILKNFAADSDA